MHVTLSKRCKLYCDWFRQSKMKEDPNCIYDIAFLEKLYLCKKTRILLNGSSFTVLCTKTKIVVCVLLSFSCTQIKYVLWDKEVGGITFVLLASWRRTKNQEHQSLQGWLGFFF
jgi:hypothetical protein